MEQMYLTILALLMFGCSSQQNGKETDLQQLSAAFVDPPMSSRPGAYWCWLNGDVTKITLLFFDGGDEPYRVQRSVCWGRYPS